jgi:hypothetical protein
MKLSTLFTNLKLDYDTQLNDIFAYSEDIEADTTLEDITEMLDNINDDGKLDELVDANIDIYYTSIRQWSVDNWEYVEQAIDDGLVDTDNYDYHKAIQSGQYLYYSEHFNDELIKIQNQLKDNWCEACNNNGELEVETGSETQDCQNCNYISEAV